MRNIDLSLNREGFNSAVSETGILQGNENVQFTLTLMDGDVPVVVADDDTPVFYFKYPNSNTIYKLDSGNNQYKNIVAIQDGKIVMKPNRFMVSKAGDIEMVVELQQLYTYSVTYRVDPNMAYTDRITSFDDLVEYLRNDFSNVDRNALERLLTDMGYVEGGKVKVDMPAILKAVGQSVGTISPLISLVDGDKPVTDKRLVYDISTNALKVIDK